MPNLYQTFQAEFAKLLENKNCLYAKKSNTSANYSGTTKEFLGITVPCLRQFAKKFYTKYLKNADQQTKIELLNQLFTSNIHEYYKVASELLNKDKKLLYAIDWDTLFKWLSNAQGWEEVDQFFYITTSAKFIHDMQKTTNFVSKITPELIKLANTQQPENKRGALVLLIRPLRKFKDEPEELAKLKELARELLALPTYKEKHPPIVKKAIRWLERVVAHTHTQ